MHWETEGSSVAIGAKLLTGGSSYQDKISLPHDIPTGSEAHRAPSIKGTYRYLFLPPSSVTVKKAWIAAARIRKIGKCEPH
jgi:hypothetical protein